VVGADLAVDGRDDLFALGDAAAVPDLVRGGDAVCAPTAQHATRQAKVAADNVAAVIHGRRRRDYRHHDLGMVVDLGGSQAVATPLRVPLTGRPAQLVTCGYHLMSMGAPDSMRRVAANWLLHAIGGHSPVRLGFKEGATGLLADFEATDDYVDPDEAARRCDAVA
jgi:NADH:ubiquinone reductase (H+-translocating)